MLFSFFFFNFIISLNIQIIKSLILLAFSSSLLFSINSPTEDLKLVDRPAERTCCSRYANNGQIGEEFLMIRVSSCVSFDAAAETLGDANGRACKKAQDRANTLVGK